MIYVVRCNTGQFYRRGKLVRSREAASFGHSPSGVAGILARARAAFPALQWEAVPFRDACDAKEVGSGCSACHGGYILGQPCGFCADGVSVLGEAHPTAQECDVANRLLDTLMREAHGTTVWPAHWMAVRAQLVAAIRNAGMGGTDGR